MVEVKLYAKTVVVNNPTITTTEMLNMIASQSRTEKPLEEIPREDLFKDTIKWKHDSIQEFVDYTFWIGGVSRTLLSQLTRHRMASYNVLSHRHVKPNSLVFPKKFERIECRICFCQDSSLVNDIWIKYHVDNDGKFIVEYVDYKDNKIDEPPFKLEDIRMLFPSGVTVNLFMKMNGRSIRNFLKLRISSHAQSEIRELAIKIHRIVQKDCAELLYGLVFC